MFDAASLLKVHQVDHNLAWFDLAAQGSAIDAARADDDHFGLGERAREIRAEQGTHVRNDFLDVLAVRPDEVAERNVVVPDL